jgi:hypothetical protein
MKNNHILLLLVSVFIAGTLHAQTYTRVTNTLVSKGIKYQKYTATSPHPQEIHVLEINIADLRLNCNLLKPAIMWMVAG